MRKQGACSEQGTITLGMNNYPEVHAAALKAGIDYDWIERTPTHDRYIRYGEDGAVVVVHEHRRGATPSRTDS